MNQLISLLPRDRSATDTSAILIQDAVTATDIPVSSVHVLEEDLALRQVPSPFPRITYADMLQMIFDAKRVVVL